MSNYSSEFFDLSVDMLCAVSSEGYFIEVNSAWEKTLGWSKKELTSKPFLEFVHPDDQKSTFEEVKKVTAHSIKGIAYDYQNRYLHKDGSYRWFDWNVQPLVKENVIYAVARDITKHKLIEQALQKSRDAADIENKEILTTILQTLPVVVFAKDIKKNFTFSIWNKTAEELFGLKAEDCLGKDDYDLFPKEQADFYRTKDLEASKIKGVVDIPAEIIQTTRGPIWVHTRKAVIRNASGEPSLLLGVCEDLTLHRRNEESLKKSLSIRDDFISIASHELKTPITSLKMQLQIMRHGIKPELNISPSPAALARGLDASAKQINRLTELVEDLLDASMIQSGKLRFNIQEFNISEAVTEFIERFSALFSEVGCKLDLEIESGIFGRWDQGRIEQVLANLVTNAIKYAPGKPIFIKLHKNNDRVIFAIKDSGPGISPGEQSQIFDRFVRGVSRNINGVGLGLYISKQIAEAHKGTLTVESEVGEGSTFILNLPTTGADNRQLKTDS